MKLILTEGQALLEQSVLKMLAGQHTFAGREERRRQPGGCASAIWKAFADLGLLALPFPDELEEFGGDSLAIGLVMHALGRHLVTEPFHACVLVAARLLGESGTPEQRQQWMPSLLAGTRRVALAHDESDQPDPWEERGTRAVVERDGWRLDGSKALAVGAPGADALLVSTTVRDGNRSLGQRVFLVAPDMPGVHLHPAALADGSQVADVRLTGVRLPRNAVLGEDQDISARLQRALAEGIIAQCWEASGVMQAAMEQTADHVRQRVQFNQPLARFQVVSHRVAEMAVHCAEARAACELASLRIGRGDRDVLALASMAKSKVGRGARPVAQGAVQLHGGMGVCEELPIASYFRKLHVFMQQGGSTAWHTRRLGQALWAGDAWRGSATLAAFAGEVSA